MKILDIKSKTTLLVVFVISVLLLFPFVSSAQNGNGKNNAIPAGTLNPYSPSVFFRTGSTLYNSNNYYSYHSPNAQPSPEMWYSFSLEVYMDLSISVCGNPNFYFHILDASGNELASHFDPNGCGFVDFPGFPPGDYYLVAEAEGYDFGDFSLSLDSYPALPPPPGTNMAHAIYAGVLSENGTSFTDTRSNADPLLGDSIGQDSYDIYYKFDLNQPAEVVLSTCGSEIEYTYMYLLDLNGLVIASSSDFSTPCAEQAYIKTFLPAGTYYVVSEGFEMASLGYITTTIAIVNPPPVISYPSGSYTFVIGSSVTIFSSDVSPIPTYIESYSVSPALPPGLSLNESLGTISGTPTAISPATDYTVTATNSGGSGVAILNIAVVAAPLQPNNNKNYIRTTTYREPFAAVPPAPSISDAMVEVAYFDGLGRPLQQVSVKASPDGQKDIVTPVSYDAFGRQDKSYLPFATATGAGGVYKENAIPTQASFYNSPPAGVVQIPQAGGVTPSFSQTVFEASPLSRVLEQGAPGAAWQPAATRGTSGRSVLSEQATNNTLNFAQLPETRKVALYGVSLSLTGVPTLTLNGAYDVNQLYVNITKDENWLPADGRKGTVEEYTDKQGRVVLKRTFNENDLNELEMLSTYYVYDDFGNLSFVLPPGINPDRSDLPTSSELDNFAYRYRYDGRNRMVEKKLPGKGSEYIVYNELDQPILTQDSIQRTSNQWLFNKYDAFGRPVMSGKATITGTREAMQAAADAHSVLWETADNSNLVSGYRSTTETYPAAGINHYLAINYYDNYAFPGADSVAAQGSYSQMTRSLPTGSRVYTADGTASYLSASYYDDKGRVTEMVSLNHVDGMDRILNTYNFSGELLTSVRVHTGYNQTSEIGTRYSYDHMGRKLKTVQYIDNPTDTVVLSQLAYNEIGQLIEKRIHSRNGGPFLNTESYSYNARGWLKSQSGPRFALELKYEDGTEPQYNGNISNQYWGTGASPMLHNYSYLYDKLNRLTNGTSDEGFNELISYDKMGNITSMNRNPVGINTYSYSGNRLTGISGAINGSYSYDANGNQTADSHKGITLAYNYLNLPETISKAATSETMTNTWLATGAKIRKTVAGMTREYVGGIEYNDGVIEFIQTEEGRAIMNSNATYNYEYMLKDHLGNTRVLLDENGTVLETSDYYPFGLQVARGQTVTSPENRYKYNGKELQTELGLMQYDYGARFYDPVIGRFNVIDRFVEKYYSMTSYQYGANNPIRYIDINGDSLYVFNPNGTYNRIIDDGRKEVTGIYFKNSSKDKDGNVKLSGGVSFGFNDLDSDIESILSGDLRVRLVSNDNIESAMKESGVDDTNEKWQYIERESRPKGDESILSGKSAGKMDYAFNNSQSHPGYLHVVTGQGGTSVAYNMQDFGNFLWGQGGNRLGFGLNTLKGAAHLNNAVNSRSDNPGSTYRILDSNGDQRAISNGYYYKTKSQQNGQR